MTSAEAKKKQFKLYDFVEPEMATDRFKPPHPILIPQQLSADLFPHKEFVWGERVSTTWYATFDMETQSFKDPVVKMSYRFDRDEEGLLVGRKITISWTYRDGTWSEETKSRYTHIIDSEYKLGEIKKRRQNVISELKGSARDTGLGSAITMLFDDYLIEVQKYVEAGSTDMRDAIMAKEAVDAYAWLNAPTRVEGITVRQHLAYAFGIGIN